MQWEFCHRAFRASDMAEATAEANRLGLEGWEPVGIATSDSAGMHVTHLAFKRPLLSEPN